MKIVYIVPLLAPYAIPRYRTLAQLEDTEVHVIVEQNGHKERSGWVFQEIEGVKMHLLNSKIVCNYKQKNKHDRYLMSNTRLYSLGLKKAVSQINPDVVLVCNSTQILMLSGKRKYKLGVIVEDTLRAAESRSILKKGIKRHMLKKADFYLPFTNDAKKFLKYNGITSPIIKSSWSMDIDFFANLSIEERLDKRVEFTMGNKKSYILVSNLIPRKGIQQFLDGWASMDKQFHIKSKLFILGDGELKTALAQQIYEKKLSNVFLLGNKNYQEVSYYLQCGDIFVLPTLEDLCSLSVLEAMASSRPILTTIYNGAREFVKEGINGFIFDPLKIESIVETLKKIDEADLNKMSEASSEIIKKYSTDKVMLNLRKNLDKVI